MDKLELAWQTYDFHTEMIYNFEMEHESCLNSVKGFISKNLNPKQVKKIYFKRKINKSFNQLKLLYKKQMDAIADLIEIHKHYEINDIAIPLEREVRVQLLYELKNITATLIEKSKAHQKEINEVLR